MSWTINNLEKPQQIVVSLGGAGRHATPEYQFIEERYRYEYRVGSLEPGAPWPALGLPDAAIRVYVEYNASFQVPAAPAIGATEHRIDGERNVGWDAGAIGAEFTSGASFSFNLDSDDAGAIVGVSHPGSAATLDPRNMLLSVGAFSGGYTVFVEGVAKASGAFDYADVWQFVHDGTKIAVVHEGVPVYGINIDSPVVADAALYLGRDRILDAVAGTDTIPGGSYTIDDLTAPGSVGDDDGGSVNLLAIGVYGSDAPASFPELAWPGSGGGSFEMPLSAVGDDAVAPVYGVGALYTPVIGLWAFGDLDRSNDGGDAEIAPLLSAGWDVSPVAEGYGEIAPMAIGFAYPTPSTLSRTVPRCVCRGSLVTLKLTRLSGKVPRLSLAARTGHRLFAKAPVPALSSSLTSIITMRLDETIGYG